MRSHAHARQGCRSRPNPNPNLNPNPNPNHPNPNPNHPNPNPNPNQVPWSHDPSYHEPFGDYFTDEFHDIVKRDLALFVEMGANTVRRYLYIDIEGHTYRPDTGLTYPNPNPSPK